MRVHRTWQRGETHLHGLRLFGDEIPTGSGSSINISPTLVNRHRMFGAAETCERLTEVFLGRQDLRVTCLPHLAPWHDLAFLSAEDFQHWTGVWPELEPTATRSPAGEIVVVYPKRAGRQGSTDRQETAFRNAGELDSRCLSH